MTRRDRGQMYVVEAIIAGFVLLGAVLAVQSIPTPSAPTQSKLAQLKATGDDALRTLDHTPPGSPQADYDHTNSSLVQIIATNDTAGMRTFLAEVLPSNARYEILLRNATASEVWLAGDLPRDGEIVVSHRIVAVRGTPSGLEGNVLDVQLKLWFV